MQRRLRILAASAVTVALLAAPSYAIDFKGASWGIGAPILFSDGTEIALMKIRSSSSAWGLDISYFQNQTRSEDFSGLPGTYQLNNSSTLALGPRLRHYMGEGASFAPYYDIFVDFVQTTQQSTNGTNTNDTHGTGVQGGVSLGAEYLSPWHMSVAVHTNLLSSRYVKEKNHTNAAIGDRDQTQWSNVIGIQPFVFIRAYF
jgi:hypothetical protein